MKKKTFYPFCALAAALSGCQLTIIPVREPDHPPIQTHPNKPLLFSSQKIYDNIEQHELEKRLVELAGSSPVEEAWMYNATTKQLMEVGVWEESSAALTIHPLFYSEFAANGDRVSHYHLHVDLSGYFVTQNLPPERITKYLNTTNTVLAIPSPKDIDACIGISEWYAQREVSLECKIVDYEGVLSFKLRPSVQKQTEKILKLADQANDAYASFQLSFEGYVTLMDQLGIEVKYDQLKDVTLEFKPQR